MENIKKPNCGPRLDRLPNSNWHWSMFGMVACGLLVCWSNAIGGLVLAQLKDLGWTNNSTSAVFSSLTIADILSPSNTINFLEISSNL